jgi:ankyrin repeat protein
MQMQNTIGTLIDPQKKAMILQRIRDGKVPLFMEKKPEPEKIQKAVKRRKAGKLDSNPRHQIIKHKKGLIIRTFSKNELDIKLSYAARDGMAGRVEELVKAGVDINARVQGTTPLMWASINGRSNTVRLLIKMGANVNLGDNHKVTALMFASKYGHVEVVKELIRAGAEINRKDRNGKTAIKQARSRQQWKVEQILQKAGAVD